MARTQRQPPAEDYFDSRLDAEGAANLLRVNVEIVRRWKAEGRLGAGMVTPDVILAFMNNPANRDLWLAGEMEAAGGVEAFWGAHLEPWSGSLSHKALLAQQADKIEAEQRREKNRAAKAAK